MEQTRITRLFERLRTNRRKALVAYLTAGDPCLERTPALVEALERGGADLIELGVPFSDPIADGPVIQRAAQRALAAGATLDGVLEAAAGIRRRSEVPLVLFTYLNPVLRRSVGSVARRAAASGIDGFLLTDLSVEEAGDHMAEIRGQGLDTVFLAAPTSTPRRLELVARYSSGFVYLVSRTGVTGERSSFSGAAAALVESMRRVTTLPLALGFGISTPRQVAEAAGLADAAVVGSAFVRLIENEAGSPGLEARLEAFTRELKGGL